MAWDPLVAARYGEVVAVSGYVRRLREAAVREAREEIGVEVELTRLIDVFRFAGALPTATGQLERGVPDTARSRRGMGEPVAAAVQR